MPLTLKACEVLLDGKRDYSTYFNNLGTALKTRKIVSKVQFEDGAKPAKNRDTHYVSIVFKLSPFALENTEWDYYDLELVSWSLLCPRVKTMRKNLRPKDAVEFLEMSKIECQLPDNDESWLVDFNRFLEEALATW